MVRRARLPGRVRPDIAPGEPAAERQTYEQVLLEGRLREALRRLNPAVPAEALDEAFRKLTRIPRPSSSTPTTSCTTTW